MRVVHDAVEDRVGDGGIVQPRMPLADGQLAGDDGRLGAHAVVEGIGFRQLTVLFRLLGYWRFFRGVDTWGRMPREGIGRTA